MYVVARATSLLARAVSEDAGPGDSGSGDAGSDLEVVDRKAIPIRILGRSRATCNLVPVDRVADQIVSVVLDPRCHGVVRHMVNCDPPTHGEIKAWLEAYFDIGGGVFCDQTGSLDDPNHYEEMFYSLGNVVGDYFRDGLVFESQDEGVPGARLVDRASFLRSLAYAESRNWGRVLGAGASGSGVSGSGRSGVIDPCWYFETFLPRMIPGSNIARVSTLTTTIRFSIGPLEGEGGDEGGVGSEGGVGGEGSISDEWLCRFDGGHLVDVSRACNGAVASEFEYRVSRRAFADIVTTRMTLQEAFFHGEADIRGGIERALRMAPIMTDFLRECPVRV